MTLHEHGIAPDVIADPGNVEPVFLQNPTV
jgi:hypothetical protein